MRKYIALFLALLLAVTPLSALAAKEPSPEPTPAPTPKPVQTSELLAGLEEPACKAALLMDAETGTVLYSFHGDDKNYPASITKIMTSLVVLEAVDKGEIALDTPVTASAQAVNLPLGSSTADIKAGETLTIQQLLYCDLLPSGNDACNILAEALGGTTADFAARMNAKAQELGMKDSHFTNPHGLHDPEHYTTAYDIYLMAREAMSNETFRTVVRTAYYTLPATNLQPERTIYSSNGLLTGYYAGTGYTYSKAIGIKTGYTGEAGRCLASAAMDEEGRTFYCVVLGTEDTREENGEWHKWSFSETKRLLEWAFDNFHRITLLDQDTENVLGEVEVTLSDDADHVMVRPVGSIEATMPSDYDPKKAELIVDLPKSIEAPVTAGDKLGTITLRYNGVEYGTLDMVAADSVARSDFLYAVQQIEFYWGQWWVKALAALAAAAVAALVIFVTVVLPRRRARRRYSRSGNGRRPNSNYRGRR